jgi:hypothetical protein
MDNKFKSDTMKIKVIEIEPYDFMNKRFCRNGSLATETDPNDLPYYTEKMLKYKEEIMKPTWKLLPPNYKDPKFPLFSIPLMFNPDGLLVEGRHRAYAISQLYGIMTKPKPFICLLGWGDDLWPHKIRMATRRFRSNAVQLLINNKFKEVILTPPTINKERLN